MKLPHRSLYRAARVVNDVDALLNPRRLPKRAKNKIVGRALARASFWKRLWG